MKYFLLILLFLASIKLTYCQSVIKADNANDIIFINPAEPPVYPGGEDALRNFHRKNINLNNVVPDSNTTSQCYKITVKFIVRKDGSITDANCENARCGICSEFIRVIKETGKWLPAVQNGKKVNAYYRQSIVIDVEEF